MIHKKQLHIVKKKNRKQIINTLKKKQNVVKEEPEKRITKSPLWVDRYNHYLNYMDASTCQNLSNLVLEIDYIEYLLNDQVALSSSTRNCWVCCLTPIKISAVGGRTRESKVQDNSGLPSRTPTQEKRGQSIE